jgi:hypothetical protein
MRVFTADSTESRAGLLGGRGIKKLDEPQRGPSGQ